MRQPVLSCVAAVLCGATLVSSPAAAQNLFDFLFGGARPQAAAPRPASQSPVASFFADPFGLNPQPQPAARPIASGSGPAFCVRTCDGKYFPVRGANPAQLCQAFCPASATRVFFGGAIEGAVASNGEHYADLDAAFAYRKALKPGCSCNGRDPAGLAPVDLSLDASLRPGDVVATANGLVAYSGMRTGIEQTPEFTPVAAYPGLTAEVRARLGEMKVAPVTADPVAEATAVSPRESVATAQQPARAALR